jgi:hypothetical protein
MIIYGAEQSVSGSHLCEQIPPPHLRSIRGGSPTILYFKLLILLIFFKHLIIYLIKKIIIITKENQNTTYNFIY